MYINESLWVALGFIVFVILIWKKMKTYIENILDEKIKKISFDLSEAQKIREEAEAELDEINKFKSDSEKEIKLILSNAKSSAERIKNETNEKIKILLQRKEQQAAEKINASQDALISEMRHTIASLTTQLSEEMIIKKIDKNKSIELINNSLKNIN